jgi:hypothetical protein
MTLKAWPAALAAALILLTGAGRRPARAAGTTTELTVAQLVDRALREGAVATTNEADVFVGVTNHSLARRLDYYTTQTADGRAHACTVVVDRAAPDKPLALLWDRFEEKNGKTDFFVLRLGFDGTLVKVHRAQGRVQGDEPVAGSLREQELDPASTQARAVFEQERTFWLQGLGRKPPAEAKTYDVTKNGKLVLSVTDAPGPIVSTAIPPPDGAAVKRSFLTASAHAPEEEDALRRLLERSKDTQDFFARLRKAGYEVSPTKPAP